MGKIYEIEIVNWEWCATKRMNNLFFFVRNSHPRIKSFRTQTVARKWLESQGFEPLHKDINKPFVYRSHQGGIQATICEKGKRLRHAKLPMQHLEGTKALPQTHAS